MSNNNNTHRAYEQLERTVAFYELLHAHARGETCLTEDQLANAVTGLRDEALDVLREARGEPVRALARVTPDVWSRRARRWSKRIRVKQGRGRLDS